MGTYDAILLIAFGGPERSSDIRPFLERVTEGRQIPDERLEEVAHHYELIGGRSPLNELTFRQASALRELLVKKGTETPVYVGMRNWHPFFDETLERMRKCGHRRVLGIILSAFEAEASRGRYMEDIALARDTVGADAPVVEYAPAWADRPLFIDAVADRTRAALRKLPDEFSEPALIFTAHSIPVTMAENSPYVTQFEHASGAVAEMLSCSNWHIAYQSRSGRPTDRWLEPDVGKVLEHLAAQSQPAVVVVPVGFICDHVEVLYDLDYEANARAQELGLAFFRVPTVNDHPLFIRMLAELALPSSRPLSSH
jgi:ferrochelatase